MQKIKLVFMVILLASFSSCGIADLRTSEIKNNKQTKNKEEYAIKLLEDVIEKQGLANTKQFSTYEVKGSDHWKGMLGKIGNIWNWNKDTFLMRYSLGDFDGQLEVLEGKKKGFIAGIQSWDYYEKIEGQYKTDVKDDKRIIFGLGAYHYYFELVDRLLKAPFIRYAGKDKLNGQEIEKVFVSWGNERTKSYDQYVVWIGTDSGLMESVTHTVRDNYLPMSGFLYSSASFSDYRDMQGVLIPFKQTIQLKKPKDNLKKYIHQFSIEAFQWDSFAAESIRPLDNLPQIGDDKIVN